MASVTFLAKIEAGMRAAWADSQRLASQGDSKVALPEAWREAPYILAYSGGADSTALLHGLCALNVHSIRVVYVQHNLRTPTEQDEELTHIHTTLKKLGFVLGTSANAASRRDYFIVDLGDEIKLHSKKNKIGIEASARFLRNRALGTLAQNRLLLTGHTADDVLETLILRVFSGSSARGLRAMARARIIKQDLHELTHLRPMLAISKKEILDFLSAENISYSQDLSNFSPVYTRNKIRQLVPELDALLPAWRSGLFTTARRAALEDEVLAGLAPACNPFDGQSIGLPANFFQLGKALQLRVLLDGLALIWPQKSSNRIPLAYVEEILRQLLLVTQGDSRLVGKFLIKRDATTVIIQYVTQAGEVQTKVPNEDAFFVEINSVSELGEKNVTIESAKICLRIAHENISLQVAHKIDEGGDALAQLWLGDIEFPITIRTAHPTDTIAIKAGHKKIKRVLHDCAIARDALQNLPIICDQKGLVLVLGKLYGGQNCYRYSEGYEKSQAGQGTQANTQFLLISNLRHPR